MGVVGIGALRKITIATPISGDAHLAAINPASEQ